MWRCSAYSTPARSSAQRAFSQKWLIGIVTRIAGPSLDAIGHRRRTRYRRGLATRYQSFMTCRSKTPDPPVRRRQAPGRPAPRSRRPAKLRAVIDPLRTVTATRYVEALREGGSLPGLVEADDDGMYVTKFRGAGQGEKALVAEVVAGELARALGLPVPELVVVDVDVALAAAEPDPEIQDLIQASPGPNLGMDFLPGALPYTPGAADRSRARGRHRLVRHAHHERRPHAPQPQPARSGAGGSGSSTTAPRSFASTATSR